MPDDFALDHIITPSQIFVAWSPIRSRWRETLSKWIKLSMSSGCFRILYTFIVLIRVPFILESFALFMIWTLVVLLKD